MGLSHSPRIVTDGLVFCVDAGDKMSYPGAGTTWTDLSKEGNNTTLVNGPTFNSENGGSIVFDGTNDYGWFNRNGGTNFDGKDEISICTWVNYQSTGSLDSYVMMEDNFAGDFQEPVRIAISPSGTFKADICSTNSCIVNSTDVTVVTNQWFNFSFTYDGAYIKNYINSNFKSSVSQSGNIDTPLQSNARWLLGCGELTRGERFSNVKLASIQMYNRALSAEEIKQNYNATRGRFQ
jgi:hypothetical protein